MTLRGEVDDLKGRWMTLRGEVDDLKVRKRLSTSEMDQKSHLMCQIPRQSFWSISSLIPMFVALCNLEVSFIRIFTIVCIDPVKISLELRKFSVMSGYIRLFLAPFRAFLLRENI